MGTLQLLWPYIIGLICTGIVLSIIYVFLMKYVPDDTVGDGTYTTRQIIRKIFFWLIIVILAGFVIYSIKIASTNVAPRSEPDKSQVRESEQNWERKAREDAATRKTTKDTTASIPNH